MKNSYERQESVSVLTRLLAEENLTVVHSSTAETAAFIPSQRKVVLPTYGDSISFVTQAGMALHETGHATDTPEEVGDLMRKYGPALVNILEDVRIEKIVKDKYPGSRKYFSQMYDELVHDHDFFGTAKNDNPLDFSSFNFLDRVNIHFKLGARAMVPFSAEEQEIVDRIAKIKTIPELEALAKELRDIAKENESKTAQKHGGDSGLRGESDDEGSDTGADGPSSVNDDDGEESDGTAGGGAGEESDGDDSDGAGSDGGNSESAESEDGASGSAGAGDDSEAGEGDDSASGEESDAGSSGSAGNDGNDSTGDGNADRSSDKSGVDLDLNDLDNSETENASKEALRKLARAGGNELRIPRSSTIIDIVQPWTDIAPWVKDVVSGVTVNDDRGYDWNAKTFDPAEVANRLASFRESVKPVLNKMIAEFNRTAAGAVSRRTSYKDTGALDPLRMIHYRYNENIFKKRKYVRDGKNHGVVLFVDFTGSMNGRMPKIMRQVVLMVDFCRKVNIPFRVYGWSDCYLPGTWEKKRNDNRSENWGTNRFNSTAFVEIFSSAMSSNQLEMFSRWAMTCYGMTPGCYTPLVPTMYYALPVIRKFRLSEKVDVVKMMLFTDGEGHVQLPGFGAKTTIDEETGTMYAKEDLENEFFQGDHYHWQNHEDRQLHLLSKVLKDRYDVSTVYMFMNQARDCKKKIKDGSWTDEAKRAANKDLRAMEMAHLGRRGPMDWVVMTDGYDIETGEFKINAAADATDKQLKKAMLDAATQRKGSTLFATTVANSLTGK